MQRPGVADVDGAVRPHGDRLRMIEMVADAAGQRPVGEVEALHGASLLSR